MSFIPTPANDFTDMADEAEISRLTAEWSIAHRGRYYHYDGYRYECLADAVAYAQLGRARQTPLPDAEAFDVIEPPNAMERDLIRELSISLENDIFVFEGFRYDKLIDAANYARHRRQLGVTTP